METDQTQPGAQGEKHPTLAELRAPAAHPQVSQHLASCSMCRSIVSADDDDVPIALDLPKGLVSEAAFRWPADPIARGGMAQIFAGEDRRLGRTVILKAPREGDELPAGMAELFQRRVTAEARILAKLQHPSIVTIYELGKASVGWPFCVLEKVEGDSLRDRLDELASLETEGKPCTRERLELLSNLVAIAEALAYAHEQRIVHRDCTPNNIILGKRGEATLIDWGIARDLDAPGEVGTALVDSPSASGRMVTISAGTPPYLPLEQSQGRSAEPSFDVYSFGITLYEVVSGRTPFEWKHVDGQGRAAQLAQFLTWLKAGEPVPPAMPRDLELSGIIARAMAHDPARRFTADELVKALKQYLTGDLVFSHRYSVTGRLARWARQHRAATVGMISILLFAVAGVLVWLQLARSARATAELQAEAAAARSEAGDKAIAAADASREAELAHAQAAQAEKEGKDAQALRLAAEAKSRTAEAMKKDAQAAAARSKGDAVEANRVKQDAEKARDQAESERDAARLAQQQAEVARTAAQAAEAQAIRERDNARLARDQADRERDNARQAEVAAQQERDAARTGQSRAESEREQSRAVAANAERERDAALASRSTVEHERDEARRKLVELEARLRDAERGPPPGPPGPPPAGP